MRERLLLWGAAIGGAVVIFAIAVGIYLGYSWYQRRFGPTAERALETYFTAMADAEYGVMYKMTPDADLMVLGRKLSEEDFAKGLDELLGDEKMVMEAIEVDSIAQRGEYQYFKVTLHYTLGGTGKVARLLVEMKPAGGEWEVTYPFTPNL